MKIQEIEKVALKLSSKERAALSYKLLESIDAESQDNIDKIWQQEVEERYNQITNSLTQTKNSELVIKEAKLKYK
ncbi:MAG: addiction module protein [Bacteroidota bacterium]